MTRKQKAELRLSEIRQALNKYAGKDALSSEEAAKVTELEGQLRAAEVEQRAAIREEAEQAANTPADPQLTALERRCELRRYADAVVAGRAFDGAEAELQDASGLSGHNIPLAALAPHREPEQRADATTNAPSEVGQNQRGILGRIFARSSAQWLGVRFDRVPVGQSVYPVITAGSDPSRLAKGADYGNIAAGTLTATKLEPVRSQIAYSARYEDLTLFGGSLESALRQDMSMSLSEHVDSLVLAGSGANNQPTGLFNALTDPTDPGTAATFSTFVGPLAALVDGRYAHSLADLRLLLGADTFASMASIFSNSGSGDISALQHLEQGARVGGTRVSPHVPAKSGSNVQKTLVRKGQYTGAAVAAFWPSIQLIMDRVTAAKEGRINLTMISLWNFAVLRADSFALVEYKLS